MSQSLLHLQLRRQLCQQVHQQLRQQSCRLLGQSICLSYKLRKAWQGHPCANRSPLGSRYLATHPQMLLSQLLLPQAVPSFLKSKAVLSTPPQLSCLRALPRVSQSQICH